MADIDAELLALAGDDSSEEDDAPVNLSRANSASPDGKANDTSAKQSTGKKSGGTKAKRGNHNDSEEEGEASSGHSSPDSLQSAPMDESESDSDTSPANLYEDGDRFPLEGKYMNHADKSEITAMPEIQREELLAERAQQVERDRQNRALRQLLNAREAVNKKSDKKRKAAAADLDETQRKTSRQRTKVGGGRVGEASTGIDSLKRARAEKDDRQRRRQEDKDRNRGRANAHNDFSDVDADGDSEVEWDDGKQKAGATPSPDHRDAQPADLRDVDRIRVGRTQFALVCFYPGFDDAINGCYVRISIGLDQKSKENIYRMAVIKGFTEGKPYAMETANGNHFITTQYVRAAHGKAEKEWPFISCSNSSFTEGEWNRYKVTCAADGIALPIKPKLISKIANINDLVNRSWTEDELQEKLRRSGALKNKFIPIEEKRLSNLLKEAIASSDDERAEELRVELDALNGPKLAFGTSLKSTPKKQTGPREMTQQEKLAELNRQNRRKNIEEVRQAQINERRKFLATEAAIARGEEVVEDHSRRVKTRAKFKHDINDLGKKSTDRSGTNTPGTSTPNMTAKKDNTPLPHIAKLQERLVDSKGIPTFRKVLTDDDIIGAIDLDIDIEI